MDSHLQHLERTQCPPGATYQEPKARKTDNTMWLKRTRPEVDTVGLPIPPVLANAGYALVPRAPPTRAPAPAFHTAPDAGCFEKRAWPVRPRFKALPPVVCPLPQSRPRLRYCVCPRPPNPQVAPKRGHVHLNNRSFHTSRPNSPPSFLSLPIDCRSFDVNLASD